MTGTIELPVTVEDALVALRHVIDAHQRLETVRSVVDGVDLVAWRRTHEDAEQVRLTVRDTGEGTSELVHASWGESGVASPEHYWTVVDDLLERLRTEIARDLTESIEAASGAYVGTLVGGEGLGVEPGRAVAVVFGSSGLWLRYAGRSVDLDTDRLVEVEAVPTSTAGLKVDPEALERAVAHAPVGTVLGIETSGGEPDAVGLHCLIHLGGSTTSIVNAELDHLRAALQPAGLAMLSRNVIRRRQASPKISSTELIRQLSALAQLHHAGDLTEREWAEGKAKLLGID